MGLVADALRRGSAVRKATKLEDLRIDEISGVPKPANQLPGWIVMKGAAELTRQADAEGLDADDVLAGYLSCVRKEARTLFNASPERELTPTPARKSGDGADTVRAAYAQGAADEQQALRGQTDPTALQALAEAQARTNELLAAQVSPEARRLAQRRALGRTLGDLMHRGSRASGAGPSLTLGGGR